MKYYIAYFGNDSDSQKLPMLEGPFDNTDDASSFIIDRSNSKHELNNPAIISTPDIIEEQITWDYVRSHLAGEDLCKSCDHYWLDFPLPLDHYESHCDILDQKGKLLTSNIVPFPCLKCPFNSYIKKK